MKRILFGTSVDSVAASTGVMVLRLVFGLTMAFAHGIGKMPPPDKMLERVAEIGFPLPVVFAWAASLSEFAGGILIAIGLLTRPSAAFLAFTMLVAAFVIHADDPFQKKELAILFFGASLAMIFLGAGRYSVDARICHGVKTKKPKK